MAEYKTFETERLLLVPATESDAEFFYELMNSPKYMQHVGDRNILSIENARDFIILKMLPQLHRLGFSNYVVIRKEDNTKIGSCGLFVREGYEDIDIGFAFLPDFAKNGYAFEAANQLKKAAFETFGIQAICAYTAKSNLASQKLISKLGLNYVGITKLPNDNEELLTYKVKKNSSR